MGMFSDIEYWKELAVQRKAEAMEFRKQRDELVAALEKCRDMVGHPDNLAFIDEELAAFKAQPAGWEEGLCPLCYNPLKG